MANEKPEAQKKPRRAPKRKPFYLLTRGPSLSEAGIEIIGITNDAEETLEMVDKNEGVSYIRVAPQAAKKAE